MHTSEPLVQKLWKPFLSVDEAVAAEKSEWSVCVSCSSLISSLASTGTKLVV